MLKLFSSALFFSDFKSSPASRAVARSAGAPSSQAQAVSRFLFTVLLVVATGAHTQPKALLVVATGAHTQPKARIENLLSLRKNFRLRRRCRSYFLVYCSFPISKFPRRRRPFLNFYLPPCWWSQKARVNCSFPISKFPRRRRPFLNFHTALLMIATGAHTQTKSTSGKKICFRFAKFFAFGDGAEVIF